MKVYSMHLLPKLIIHMTYIITKSVLCGMIANFELKASKCAKMLITLINEKRVHS